MRFLGKKWPLSDHQLVFEATQFHVTNRHPVTATRWYSVLRSDLASVESCHISEAHCLEAVLLGDGNPLLVVVLVQELYIQRTIKHDHVDLCFFRVVAFATMHTLADGLNAILLPVANCRCFAVKRSRVVVDDERAVKIGFTIDWHIRPDASAGSDATTTVVTELGRKTSVVIIGVTVAVTSVGRSTKIEDARASFVDRAGVSQK